MFCLNCSQEIPDNSKFCFNCGTKIETIDNICNNCGQKNVLNAKFCFNCGNRLVIDKQEDQQNNKIKNEGEVIENNYQENSLSINNKKIIDEIINSVNINIDSLITKILEYKVNIYYEWISSINAKLERKDSSESIESVLYSSFLPLHIFMDNPISDIHKVLFYIKNKREVVKDDFFTSYFDSLFGVKSGDAYNLPFELINVGNLQSNLISSISKIIAFPYFLYNSFINILGFNKHLIDENFIKSKINDFIKSQSDHFERINNELPQIIKYIQ